MRILFKNIPIEERKDDIMPSFIYIDCAIGMSTRLDHHIAEEYANRL
jgi:hypothetical protein